MLALLDRNRQIPGGFKFMLAEINWQSQPWSSFNTIVEGAITVSRANQFIAKKCGWPTTREGWEQRIDEYNAALCQAHGWNSFIRELPGGPPLPPRSAPVQQQPAKRKRCCGRG